MPTVLVELGFLTNASDERRLRDPAHQRVMAKAIAGAIGEYLADKKARLAALGSEE
jgi:N-acetylmuramoyl-L-alanine amidase